MVIEEIFNKIASHMIEGIMYHDEMTQMYYFLCLYGYASQQEYQYLEENYNYRRLSRYYIKHYYKLLQIENKEQPKLILETWYKYTTMAIDAGTKRRLIKDLMTKWIEWEKKTKKLYQDMRRELDAIGETAAASFIDKYVDDVSNELHHAEQQLIMLETIDYDIVQIADWQEDLYNKYKKKSRW